MKMLRLAVDCWMCPGVCLDRVYGFQGAGGQLGY